MKQLIIIVICCIVLFGMWGYVGSGNSLKFTHSMVVNGANSSNGVSYPTSPTQYVEYHLALTSPKNAIPLPFKPNQLFCSTMDSSISLMIHKSGTVSIPIAENGYLTMNLPDSSQYIDTLEVDIDDTATVYLFLAKHK